MNANQINQQNENLPCNHDPRNFDHVGRLPGDRNLAYDGMTNDQTGRTLPQTGDVQYRVGFAIDHVPFPAGGPTASTL